jgi:hypothetical protein
MGALNQAWKTEAHNSKGQKIDERIVERRNGYQDADQEQQDDQLVTQGNDPR